MSGGAFHYKQREIGNIADQIEQNAIKNGKSIRYIVDRNEAPYEEEY